MKVIACCCLIIVGMFAGYFLRTFLDKDTSEENLHTKENSHVSRNASVATTCSLPSDQVDLIANQLAPLLLKQILNSNNTSQVNLNNTSLVNSQQASQKIESFEKDREKKTAAMAKANDIVDGMLATGIVDQETMSQAIQLLEESGQAQETYKLNAKIAAAINRGDIKPENAGLPHR